MTDEPDLEEADRRAKERLRLIRREPSPMPFAEVARAAGLASAAKPRGPLVRPCWCGHCGKELECTDPRSAGPSACSECAETEAKKERVSREMGKIAEGFEWASLEGPMVPPKSETPICDETILHRCRGWLRSEVQCLYFAGRPVAVDGRDTVPTGVGKSSLAAAVARAAAEQGWRILWIRAAKLGPVYDRIEHKAILDQVQAFGPGIVFVDGLGKELALAQVGSGVITQRVPAMQELIALVYELRTKTRFVFTVDMLGETVESVYGSDAFRRIATPPNAWRVVLGTGK